MKKRPLCIRVRKGRRDVFGSVDIFLLIVFVDVLPNVLYWALVHDPQTGLSRGPASWQVRASGIIEFRQGIVFAGAAALAVCIFGKHAEIFIACLLVDPVVILVFVAQICEIGVLVAGNFGADTNDDSLTDVGTYIRDTDHVGEEV